MPIVHLIPLSLVDLSILFYPNIADWVVAGGPGHDTEEREWGMEVGVCVNGCFGCDTLQMEQAGFECVRAIGQIGRAHV